MSFPIRIVEYRTRKEVAAILGMSVRSLYNLLKSQALQGKIPTRGRLSPAHQQLIFDHVGVPYIFCYEGNNRK